MKGLRDWASFVVPKARSSTANNKDSGWPEVLAIIPTYQPVEVTFRLIVDLATHNPRLQILVVDDHSPPEAEAVLSKITGFTHLTPRVKVVRMPERKLKAEVINYGLDYLKKVDWQPDIVITSDDDIRIDQETISTMISLLQENDKLGAICSKAKIDNKNQNLLTRLQGLEFHNFNIAKLADNGFFNGPLVVQGMLAAFRYRALEESGGFDTQSLIEDYEITARLKQLNWEVGFTSRASAWTEVPETIKQLWKQRVRWNYGGLHVVKKYFRSFTAVIQDLFGHFLFLSSLILIVISFTIPRTSINPQLSTVTLIVAALNLFVSMIFNLGTMLTYSDADYKDWLIRLSLIPELLYSNLLSLVLFGSYLFFAYNSFWRLLVLPLCDRIYSTGLKLFNFLGFSEDWGTK